MATIAGRGLAPSRVTLGNGLTVIAKNTTRTPAVSINLAMRSGSECDPDLLPGGMNLLARVIDRGTAARSAADIAEPLDSRGISFSVAVSRHLFTLFCTCLAEDFEPVLALAGEIMMTPSITPDELATRKGEVVTAIRQ